MRKMDLEKIKYTCKNKVLKEFVERSLQKGTLFFADLNDEFNGDAEYSSSF